MLQPIGKAQGKRITGAPFDEHAAAVIFHTLQRLFAGWQKRLITGLHSAWAERDISDSRKSEIAKAGSGLWQWIDDIIGLAVGYDEESQASSMRGVADALAAAYAGAADHTIRQIDLSNPAAISIRTTTEATDYAATRAAEMVGKRYDADGNLIDNPDADWAITSTTRDVLRREIRDAVATDRDVDRLADHIADTGIFSDDRAEMIARTETNMAQNQGVLEAGRQAKAAGSNVRKVWTLGPNPCPQCEDAAAEGDIDLEDDFGGDAGDAPPLHPNCQCSLDLFVADDQEEEEPEEEEAEMKHASAQRFERIFKNDAADDEDETGNGSRQRHFVDELADLLVEGGSSDGEVTREDAVRWLLHSARGQSLVARMAAARKQANKGKDSPMTRTETLTRIVKQAGGLGPLCQKIVNRGSSEVTEAELTGMITAAAKAEHPGMDDARAFTKMFCGPTGETLRKAVAIAKAVQLEIMPVQVGGDDATDVNDAEKAYTQLQRLADEQRRRSPELTRDQAFARVFSDPNNAQLAQRAHKRPTPTTHYPFPR
jgi:hypothetical protein